MRRYVLVHTKSHRPAVLLPSFIVCSELLLGWVLHMLADHRLWNILRASHRHTVSGLCARSGVGVVKGFLLLLEF